MIKGHNWRIFFDNVGLYAATDCSIDIEVSPLEISHKDINPGTTGVSSKINIADMVSAKFSSSGILYTSGNAAALISKQLAGTVVTVEGTTDATGDDVITFQAIITASNITGTDGDTAKVSISGVSTSDITIGVIV